MSLATVKPRETAWSEYRTALTSAASLSPEAWDDLAERAIDAHPHYTRHVVEAHRSNGLAPPDLAVVIVWRGERLEALLPCMQVFDVTGLGRRIASPFVSPFITSTAPLVARDGDPEAALAALSAGLAEYSCGRSWRWPLLSIETRLGAALLDALRGSGWSLGEIGRFDRPVLDRCKTHAAFLDKHPHASRLKDLRRRSRRLAEAGTVSFVSATSGPRLQSAVERFLVQEWAGWKGTMGTALACKPQTASFARALFSDGSRGVSARADLLCLNGKSIAASLALVQNGTACLLKTTYDETLRAFAPGLVLEAEIVRAMHETGFAQRLDSATAPGSALESLYRDRETVAGLVAVPPGSGGASIERRVALARLEARMRADAKKVLRRR